jgi:hypothetical protein
MSKKRFAGGWEYDYWQDTVAYDAGDVVAYGDYLYRAIQATTAGQRPRQATANFTFTNEFTSDSETKALPVWVLWDLGVDYYYGLLRGVALGPFEALSKTATFGVRTLVARSNFSGSAGTSADEHLYDLPVSASGEGYGFPNGMDTVWEDPEEGELIYAPSMVERAEYGPESFSYNLGATVGVQYQPSHIVAVGGDGGATAYWDAGITTTLTIGGLFSIYQSFSRDYSGSMTTPDFQDNWINYTGDTYVDVTSTDPDFDTD